MPRKQFIADLQQLSINTYPAGIDHVEPGEDDGQLQLGFTTADHERFHVTVLVTDISDYPSSHEYILYGDEHASPQLAQCLNGMRSMQGLRLGDMLTTVSGVLTKLSLETSIQNQGSDTDSLLDHDEDDNESDVDDSDNDMFNNQSQSGFRDFAAAQSHGETSTASFRERVRHDLRTAKEAGFKVSQLGHLLAGSTAFVSISVRISRLGISSEAMDAWNVASDEYLILLIYYRQRYFTHEQLQSDELRSRPNIIGFRVCVSKRYKPTLQEAIAAFTITSGSTPGSQVDPPSNGKEPLRATFISRPLASLLEERLIDILRLRNTTGSGWSAAEVRNAEMRDNPTLDEDSQMPDHDSEPDISSRNLANIMQADHYQSGHHTQRSFPLIAMQYMLRRFAHCTKFCLVCHRPLKTDLEAIKPYVCDRSLCLYQYMTLGFGPSIEHEILTQPNVVDLLVSFCYCAVFNEALDQFPDGLALMVPTWPGREHDSRSQLGSASPNRSRSQFGYVSQNSTATIIDTTRSKQINDASWSVGYDAEKLEMLFFDVPPSCPVRKGQWIVLRKPGVSQHLQSEIHCRVKDTNYFPTISLGPPVETKKAAQKDTDCAPKIVESGQRWNKLEFRIYDVDFEKLSSKDKNSALRNLLLTLPSVSDLKQYLCDHPSEELSRWTDRLSPAVLGVLRWIIASNRACIMQVDATDTAAATAPVSEKVYGMPGYLQFRFAMGAPDKEQRFVTEVNKTAERLQLRHPTMFAWHGSTLSNWHSIIREGLHFKKISNGRAYGNGVYHAKEASTSLGYSSRWSGSYDKDSSQWCNSDLQISSVLALNEIVNARQEFISQHPFYVVQQLDWIQTRYLFVRCGSAESKQVDIRPKDAYVQDPQATPTGTSHEALVIPTSAVKTSRLLKRTHSQVKSPKSKSTKRLKSSFNDEVDAGDRSDACSISTDEEDNALLISESEQPMNSISQANTKIDQMNTKHAPADFVPGTLDLGSLPVLPLPVFASSATTQRLMKELRTLQIVQDTHTLSDLGWFVDVYRIENVYQWIVELHSFDRLDPSLALVKDMKEKSVKSIVLELRFNSDFPFSPPYARIIRPRFRTLAQGGGGHVVMGGAMCMELLTNTGWSSVSSMESVLMQIRMALISDPPARLDMKSKHDYGASEAADGYIRACHSHGWAVPPGFKQMATGQVPINGKP